MRSLVFILFVVFSCSAQNVLFSDDGERAVIENFTAGPGSWIVNGALSNTGLTYASSPVHSGQYSYAVTISSGGVNAYSAYTPGAFDPIYLKFWFYVPSGFSLASSASTSMVGLLKTPAFTSYLVGMTNSSGTLFLTLGGSTGTHAISTNVWHSAEMQYSQVAGQASVTLDGTTDISLSGLTLVSGNNNIQMGLSAGSGTVYFDDITLSDTISGSPTSWIAVRHPYPGNRISMNVQTYLWGAASTDILISSIDGTPFSTITNPGTYQSLLLAVSTLAVGSHTLLAQLKNNGGTVRTSWTEIITASGGVPTVGLDQYGNLVKAGHKVFPISGWFTNGASQLAWFQSGYINTEGWASEFNASYSASQFLSFITGSDLNCVVNGIPVIGPLNQRIDSGGCNTAGNASACTTAYTSYSSSSLNTQSCMLAWSGFDEASTNGWTVAQMQAAQTAVHANDNNHPITYDDASVPNLNLSWYSPAVVADVYSSDNYPLCYHNTYSSEGKNFASWVSMMDRDARANFGTVSNFIVLELYKFYVSPSGFDCTSVTATTVYNEAWLSVIHGRQGVAWYDNGSENSSGYGPACANDSATSCFPANPTTHIGKFVSDIATITPDNVLADPSALSVASNQTTPGSRVDVAVRQGPTGATWVFGARLTDIIANPAEATFPPLSTTITVTGLGSGYMNVLNENRTVPVFSGVFTDNFSPYGVHLYQFISGSVLSGPTTISGPVVIR